MSVRDVLEDKLEEKPTFFLSKKVVVVLLLFELVGSGRW
jgi:hypothetical protein